jgi:ABC-type dipeptide/oligopeptide/nickel transport system ATPase component
MTEADKPLLSVNNVEVIYDHVILVLKGVSLAVPAGGIVALLGANGAGKTTTLKAVSNLLRAERGDVTKGSIEFAASASTGSRPTTSCAGRDPGDGRPALLRPSHGRGEPPHRRLTPGATAARRSRATWRWSTATSRG